MCMFYVNFTACYQLFQTVSELLQSDALTAKYLIDATVDCDISDLLVKNLALICRKPIVYITVSHKTVTSGLKLVYFRFRLLMLMLPRNSCLQAGLVSTEEWCLYHLHYHL